MASSLLTLDIVAAHPERLTWSVTTPSGESVTFRPLIPTDVGGLAEFLAGLSAQTREFCTYPGYDLATVQEMIYAINRYDKLRLVALTDSGGHERVIALFEFSFDLVDADKTRYRRYGISLDGKTDCRLGPCIADAYQNQGLGTALLPHTVEIARRFGKHRIILLGGVLAHNGRAIRYYEKNGFVMQGRFVNDNGVTCLDMIRSID